MTNPTAMNIAIAEALGLDPMHIQKGGVRLTLYGDIGPLVEVTTYLTNAEGKRYALDHDVVTELKRYKLVPIDDDVSPPA